MRMVGLESKWYDNQFPGKDMSERDWIDHRCAPLYGRRLGFESNLGHVRNSSS